MAYFPLKINVSKDVLRVSCVLRPPLTYEYEDHVLVVFENETLRITEDPWCVELMDTHFADPTDVLTPAQIKWSYENVLDPEFPEDADFIECAARTHIEQQREHSECEFWKY